MIMFNQKHEHMKEYQKLKTPEGLVERSHFFIQDKDKPETRYEFYIFDAIRDCQLPNSWPVRKFDIVTGCAHNQDNYNEVSWGLYRDTFWGWFNRVHIRDRHKYEIFTTP